MTSHLPRGLLNVAIQLNDATAFAMYFSLSTAFSAGALPDDIEAMRAHWRISRKRMKVILGVLRNAALVATRWVPENDDPLCHRHVKLLEAL